jgi:hypothetical protein
MTKTWTVAAFAVFAAGAISVASPALAQSAFTTVRKRPAREPVIRHPS